MVNVKERIIGAVTVMNEEDAEKVWNLILSAFALSNIDSVEPYDDEIEAMRAYKNGNPDYVPSISQEELIKKLGL